MFLRLGKNLTRIFTQSSLSVFENFRESTVQVWDNSDLHSSATWLANQEV